MNFNCPTCSMQLMAEAQMAGQVVKCPGCDSRLQIPAAPAHDADGGSGENPGGQGADGRPDRNVWKETDPTNPNAALSFGAGMGITLVWFAFIYFFQAPPGKVSSEFTTGETLANLFYKHFTVSFVNTLFFAWAAAICYLKLLKLKHQRRAMLLDVLPRDIGAEINAKNVGLFIDHVYGPPVKLRDSLMVNRIRKALEFFEVRQNVADVASLMASQSAIDGSRIMGSYIIVKAFLWAIPLLGFIGTVIGLSHAISGMSFSNVEDVSKIVGSINNVTSGLGTAFDATLLGLVFAVFLNFPMNSLSKHEEEALNDIDAYCNEVLLPRLNDGAAEAAAQKEQANQPSFGDLSQVAGTIAESITASQQQFLHDLNALSAKMLDYASTLENRNEQYQQAAIQHLAEQMGALDARASEHMDLVRHNQETALQSFKESVGHLEESSRGVYESMLQGQSSLITGFTQKLEAVTSGLDSAVNASAKITEQAVSTFGEHIQSLKAGATDHQDAMKRADEASAKQFADKIAAVSGGIEASLKASLDTTNSTLASLETRLRSLNTVLEQIGEKQVVVQEVKKKGWFSRG